MSTHAVSLDHRLDLLQSIYGIEQIKKTNLK